MIYQATTNHIESIASLLNENDLPVEDISFEKQEFWILEEDQEIRAICGIEKYEKYALLRSLTVKKNIQKKGYGTSIYSYVLDICKSDGIISMFLLTTTAPKFFNKLGWSTISRMAVPAEVQESEEFKSICPQSAVCMMLTLEGKAKTGIQTYSKGFNCAQSVLTTYAEDLDLPKDLALKMTSGLAAGIGFKGELCGAVLGAYLTIGLKYGRVVAEDDLAKETTYFKMREFDKLFIEKHGSIHCRKLLKGNVNNQEQLDEITVKGYFEKACPVFVHTACQTIDEII